MSPLILKSLAAALLPLGLAFGASAGGDVPPHQTEAGPSCDIRVAYQGASVVLEGLVYAPVPVSGVYDMQISQHGANRSSIRQGGEFEALPGTPASLSVVSLSLGSGGYVATLNVQWDGGAADCTRHIGNGAQL